MARFPETPPASPFVAVITKSGKIYRADPVFAQTKELFVDHNALQGAAPGDLVVREHAGRGRAEVFGCSGKGAQPR